jgi:hypothetical protein
MNVAGGQAAALVVAVARLAIALPRKRRAQSA